MRTVTMQTTGIPLSIASDPWSLYPSRCSSKALCNDFRASVTILWQVIKHLLQRHVTGSLSAQERVLSFGGRSSPFRGRPRLRFIGF